jgi:acetolactate synthase-1/3 small subunit
MKQEITITVYSENSVGMLTQVSSVFSRRHINIESITASESAISGIHKYTIVVYLNESEVENLIRQIEKCVDVLKAYAFRQEEIVYQEIALYKVSSESLFGGNDIEGLVRKYGARVLEVTAEYAIIEKTGHKSETQELFERLQPFGVAQFTRSGRIAVNKLRKEPLAEFLNLWAGGYSEGKQNVK